jgi:hypothetical protein
MSSENAKAVAKEVIRTLRKPTRVVLGKIIKNQGYKDSVSKHPDIVTNTKSYKDEMRPVLEQLENERQRLINAITLKKLNKVQYPEAVRSLDILTKNIQLLGDKPTENIKGFLTKEQIDELLISRTKENNSSRQV